MWIARDKYGELNLFISKPEMYQNNWSGDWVGSLSVMNYWAEEPYTDKIAGFENLTWEDEPIEVEFTLKVK